MTAWFLRLLAHDERMLHALVLRRRRPGDLFMHGVTHLGDAATTIGLCVAMMSGVIPGLRLPGLLAAIALATSHLAVQALKRTIHRRRPQLPVGCESLIQPPDRFSFPSGHAAASMSVALGLASALPGPAATVVVGTAVLVGLSRCYLGVHYPGDVVAGWLLAAAGWAVAMGLV